MIRTRRTLALFAVALAFAAPQACAAVIVFTSQAAFQAAAPLATLATDLESKPVGVTGDFSLGGLAFSSALGNMFIIGPTLPGTTAPLPTSHMLAANGQEDIVITLPGAGSPVFGFALLTNRFAPHTATLLDASDAAFFTYSTTQPVNSVGFVGFISDTPIRKLHWVANHGEIENTALDDFYVGPLPTPARASTWGRIKSLYR